MKKKTPQSLEDLLIAKMKALYDVENQLIKALPKMAKNAADKDLKAAFTSHLKETRGHAKRLEQAFKLIGIKALPLKVEAIRGLVKDAEWVIKNVNGSAALDANLIAAGQYVEHYEMAGYGSAAVWAEETGHDKVADLLKQNLAEEKGADDKLSDLAESKINERANLQA